jgi:hypothetical protein
MNKFSLSIIVLILLQSCNLGGDYSSELSGNYFYRAEGSDLNDILSHSRGGKEIPANVIGYDYDSEFIVAKQKPAKTDEPLYEGVYVYPRGREETYYWLIVHRPHLILGPMSELEFKVATKKYNVPESLDVNKEH